MNRLQKVALAAVAGLALFATPCMAEEGRGGGKHIERISAELGLTEEQKAQLKPIFEQQRERMKARHEQRKAQIDAILTPEQRSQLEAKRAERKAEWEKRKASGERGKGQRGERRGPFADLNLSEEQKARLQEMREQGKDEMQAEREAFKARIFEVLTPEQEAKWEELKERRPHRGRRGPQQG